jgi:hypothetical protein
MSRGLGRINRLVLSAIAEADAGAEDAVRQFGERDGWWKVYRISLICARLADTATVRHYAADVERWQGPYAYPSFGGYITIARALAILERRGLVERDLYGAGSRVRLTPAGREALERMSETVTECDP